MSQRCGFLAYEMKLMILSGQHRQKRDEDYHTEGEG
jgi:hypothetical protein